MLKMALRNILRNRKRTVLSGTAIAVAVMVAIYMWSLVSGIMNDVFYNQVRTMSGHLRVLDSGYVKRERMLPLEANIPDHGGIQKIISSNSEVTLTTGRIRFGVLLDRGDLSKPVVGIGVEPDKEERISGLSKKIVRGRMITAGRQEMNIGSRMARTFGLKVGDTLTVITQTAYGSLGAMNLRIAGIFDFGVASIDRRTFYMPLGKAQELLDMDGRVTEIFVLIKNMNDAPKVAEKLRAELDGKFPGKFAVKPWQDQGMIYMWMKVAKYAYGTIYFLILMLASFVILNTMFMAVLERTKEIGTMKSLGMKDREIVRLILLEALLIGVMASAVGALFGTGMSYYLATKGLDFTSVFEAIKSDFDIPVSYVYRALFSWKYVFVGFCFGVLFSVLAAIPPAMRAAKMEPTEALKEG